MDFLFDERQTKSFQLISFLKYDLSWPSLPTHSQDGKLLLRILEVTQELYFQRKQYRIKHKVKRKELPCNNCSQLTQTLLSNQISVFNEQPEIQQKSLNLLLFLHVGRYFVKETVQEKLGLEVSWNWFKVEILMILQPFVKIQIYNHSKKQNSQKMWHGLDLGPLILV